MADGRLCVSCTGLIHGAGKGRHFMNAEFLFALYSSTGLDSRETSVSVFVFHYLLVIMAVIRKWRVARALQLLCLMSLL